MCTACSTSSSQGYCEGEGAHCESKASRGPWICRLGDDRTTHPDCLHVEWNRHEYSGRKRESILEPPSSSQQPLDGKLFICFRSSYSARFIRRWSSGSTTCISACRESVGDIHFLTALPTKKYQKQPLVHFFHQRESPLWQKDSQCDIQTHSVEPEPFIHWVVAISWSRQWAFELTTCWSEVHRCWTPMGTLWTAWGLGVPETSTWL